MDRPQRAVVAWALYDWANSAFATTVMVAFFPMFFKNFWCEGVSATLSTERIGVGNTVAGIVIAFLSLLLGAFADTGRDKKKLLGFCMLIGVAATAALYFVPRGEWLPALLLFSVATIGWSCSCLFYDSLLLDVAEKEHMDFVSSLGFAFGYLGGGLLFAANILMVMKPGLFGLADKPHAVRASFVTAAVWWIVFSLPVVIIVKYRRYARISGARAIVADSLRRLRSTAGKIVRRRELLFFLVAYWLYYDGVVTFMKMATDFGLSIGFPAESVMIALLAVQFVAFPSSLVFGSWARRFGARRIIITGIIVYLIVIFFGVLFLTRPIHFILFACLTGLAQGGIQALSRSYFGKLVPQEEATEYFGFYNVVGRMAVLGPAMVGIIAQTLFDRGVTGMVASRVGMASIALLFIAGAFMLIASDHARIDAEERA